MSRQRSDYPGSRWDKFSRWLHGDYDPFAGKLEMKRPEEFPSPPPLDWKQVDLSAAQHVGDDLDQGKQFRLFRKLYKAASCVLCLSIIVILLITVANLPPFGDPANPANNEVSERYIEKGLQETGAVNIVTGMILDYRAFDTFGESTVLFCAACCVLILLRLDDSKKAKAEEFDQIYEPREDTILEQAARILFPMIMMFGVYIVLNGHLSPGGGFSGGAIMGAGLILYLNAFGFQKTQRFFYRKNLPLCLAGRADVLLLREKLFLLHRREPSAERHPAGHAGGDFIERPDLLPQHLCRPCRRLHDVCLLRHVPEGRVLNRLTAHSKPADFGAARLIQNLRILNELGNKEDLTPSMRALPARRSGLRSMHRARRDTLRCGARCQNPRTCRGF